MKLNESAKKELRVNIEEQLKQVPDGQRVHLDKELLEDLIFFKGKNKDGRIIKVPVWTGHFLRKIDLSEISFENVFFQTGFDDFGDSIEDVMDAEDVSRFVKTGDDDFPQYRVPGLKESDIIDFSYTNANIDFSKIYGTIIVGCNFEGLDLSKANGECIEEIYRGNFSNTNIAINFNHDDPHFMDVDFSNNDFSNLTVDAKWFNHDDAYNFRFNDCNFSNTGLKINYITPYIPPIYYEEQKKSAELYELFTNGNITKEEYISQDKKYNEITSQYSQDDFYKSSIGEQIKKGHLNGCYINGKKVLSLEERQALASEKLQEYEAYKQELFGSVESSIAEQVGRMKR